MNIKQLRYFIGIVRHRSFSKAAEELGLTQPALSLQIQKLEEECEFMLIDRSRKPLGISPEGVIFYEKALQILQLVDDLDRLSVDMIDGVERQLRVGIIPTLAPYLVPLFAKDLKEKYPEVHLEIVECIADDIVNKLNYNELDLGILATPIHAKNLGYIPLFYERFYLYVGKQSKYYEEDEVSIADLNMDEVIYLGEEHCFRNQVDSICMGTKDRTKNLQFDYSSSSIEATKRIVENYGGIAFLPELATRNNIPFEFKKMIKPIKGDVSTREISIAYTKTIGMKRIGVNFVDVIIDNMPEHMQEKPVQNPLDTRLKL